MAMRCERPSDGEALAARISLAFAAAENRDGTEAAIVDRRRDAGVLTLSLVTEDIGVPVGHITFSPVKIDGQHLGWFGLRPVPVQPDRQNSGIGSALIRDGLQRLAAVGAAGRVLVREPAHYGRFGFAADDGLRYSRRTRRIFSGAEL
jgi:putative acetyltransferase